MVQPPLRLISIPRCYQSVDPAPAWGDEYRQVATCFGLANDVIATFSGATDERIPEHYLSHFVHCHAVPSDVLLAILGRDQFQDFHVASLPEDEPKPRPRRHPRHQARPDLSSPARTD